MGILFRIPKLIAALFSQGVWAWGYNSDGSAGTGSQTSVFTPTLIPSTPEFAKIFSAGTAQFGVKTNGTLWGWGTNATGVLGDYGVTGLFVTSPIQIGNATDWSGCTPATGLATSTAIVVVKSNGTMWAWGLNSNGELNVPEWTEVFTPTQVGTDTNWQQVWVYNQTTYALKSNGQIWSVGQNTYGQMGVGSFTPGAGAIFTWTQVGVDMDWSYVVPETEAVIFVKNDSTLWSCGRDEYGILGHGTLNVDLHTPTQIFVELVPTVFTALTASSIASSHYNVFMVDFGGAMWSWGSNWEGSLGQGYRDIPSDPPVSSRPPTQVGTNTDWLTVIPTGTLGGFPSNTTFALTVTGTLWAWGANQFSQLGLGAGRPITYLADEAFLTQGGMGYTPGTYLNVPLVSTNGTGVGAIATVTVDANGDLYGSYCTITNPGSGYAHDELLTVNIADVGGTGDGLFTTAVKTSAFSPVQVGVDTDWDNIFYNYTAQPEEMSFYGIKTGKATMVAWGWNAGYELGLGDTTRRHEPTLVGVAQPGHQFVDVAPGSNTIATLVMGF